MQDQEVTASITMPVTKWRKKNSETAPFFIDPPDNVYALYFMEFEVKGIPNFAVEELFVCKNDAAVSEDSTDGTDQTADSLWGKSSRASSCSLGMR